MAITFTRYHILAVVAVIEQLMQRMSAYHRLRATLLHVVWLTCITIDST
ncbi:MAG: hypothetical protein ACO1Q7_12130 [Gemmatimonas sp.]